MTVDRVELKAPRVLDELDEPARSEQARPRAGQVLPFEKERGDGTEGKRRTRHRRRSQGARGTRSTDTECAGNT